MNTKECVVCKNKTYHKLIHKETKEEYPFCLECFQKGFFNEDIFSFKVQEEK